MIRGAVGALWVCCGHAASVLWSCYGRGAGVLWDCCPDGGANPSQVATEMPIQVGSGAVGVVVVVNFLSGDPPGPYARDYKATIAGNNRSWYIVH